MALIIFAQFIVVAEQIIPLDKSSRAIYTVTFAISGLRGYHGKALLLAHLCERGLALSPLQAHLCGNHYT